MKSFKNKNALVVLGIGIFIFFFVLAGFSSKAFLKRNVVSLLCVFWSAVLAINFLLLENPVGKKAFSRLFFYALIISFFTVYTVFFSDPQIVLAASAEYGPCTVDGDCNSNNCVANYTSPCYTECIADGQCATQTPGIGAFGWFPEGSCTLQRGDDSTSGCGCECSNNPADTTCWDATGTKCCSNSADDWLFTGSSTKGCDNGVVVNCASGTACRFIDGATDYYCTGSIFTEASTAAGQTCNTNYVCDGNEGTCCNSNLIKDTDTSTYNCGCDAYHDGFACDGTVTGGTFTQDKVCMFVAAQSNYLCYAAMASYNSGLNRYIYGCEYPTGTPLYGDICDTTYTNGNFNANGVCYGSGSCCTTTYVDGDNDGNFDDNDCGCSSTHDGKRCDSNVDRTWDGVCAYTGAAWTCDTSGVFYDGSDYRTAGSSATDGYRCMSGSVGSGGFSQNGMSSASSCTTSDVVCPNGKGSACSSCSASSDGNMCDSTVTSGDFGQTGICASVDGNSFDCDVSGHVVYTSVYYDSECAGLESKTCDASIVSGGNYGAEGVCVDSGCVTGLVSCNCGVDESCSGDVTDAKCSSACSAGYACDADVGGNAFEQDGLCLDGTTCDNAGVVAKSGSTYYADCTANYVCDDSITLGDWVQTGVCYGGTTNCCTSNNVIDSDRNGNADVCAACSATYNGDKYDSALTSGVYASEGRCAGSTKCTVDYVDADDNDLFDDAVCGCTVTYNGKKCVTDADADSWDGICVTTDDGSTWDCVTSGVFWDGTYYRSSGSNATDGYRCMSGSVGSGGFSQNGMGAESVCRTSGTIACPAGSGSACYYSCTLSEDGYQCDNTVTSGDFSQTGACATNDDGSTWTCDTDASDVASTGTYNATDCYVSASYNYLANSCDSLGNSGGNVAYDGVCFQQTGTTWNCCTTYSTNSTELDNPDVCGNEATVCGASSNGLKCDDVSDATWSPGDQRCDESSTSCRVCTFATHVDSEALCESGCGANSICDEIAIEAVSGNYCCHSCTSPDNTVSGTVVWGDCDYSSQTGSSDYCFDLSADQCFHQSGDSCTATGWDFTETGCPNPRHQNQAGSWVNNSYCTSNCADSGTSCYYETGSNTPADRSDDCSASGCQVTSCSMQKGFLCQATTGCTCDNTECAADAVRQGYQTGSCSGGACNYSPKVDTHSMSPDPVYINEEVTFTATVSSDDEDIAKTEVWAYVTGDYSAYEMSCTDGSCSYSHNFTDLGQGQYYINVTDNNGLSNTSTVANWYQESLTVDYLNFTPTGHYPEAHLDYGQDIVVQGHLVNDRTNADETGISVTVKVINTSWLLDNEYSCSGNTDGTGNFTCTMTSVNLTKPGNYNLTVLLDEVQNTDDIKNDENTTKEFKFYEPIVFTNDFWGKPDELHVNTTASYQNTGTLVSCTDCGNYTLMDADSGEHKYLFTTDASGVNKTIITDTPLKPGVNTFTTFVEYYGNGTSSSTSIIVNGTVYSVSLSDSILSHSSDDLTVTVNVNNTGNINLSSLWGFTEIYYGEDNLEPLGSPETAASKLNDSDSYIGLLTPAQTLQMTYDYVFNETLPVGTYGLLSYFGDTNTGGTSWDNKVGVNQSGNAWSNMLPQFYLYNYTATHGSVLDPVNVTEQTIYADPVRDEEYGSTTSCYDSGTCTILLNVTRNEEVDVYAKNAQLTWNSTSSRYDYTFWPNLCYENNYTIWVGDTAMVNNTFNGTFYFNCSLNTRALVYRQPEDDEDIGIFEGNFIDKTKGTITFFLEAFDPSGHENIDFVGWNITNTDTGEVYTEFSGSCMNTSLKKWRCNQTLDPELSGCHQMSSQMYVQGTNASRNSSRSLNFYVDAIDALFDYDSSVLLGTNQPVIGQVSYCSGETYGDYSNLSIEITTPTSGEVKKTETITPSGNFYSSYTPDIQGSKHLRIEVTDSNMVRGFTLSFIDVIAISKTVLTLSPITQAFDLGREGQRAYMYVIDNPSSEPMSYNLQLTSAALPMLFSDNLASYKNLTVGGDQEYVGYVDVLPVSIGEYSTTFFLANKDFPYDNTSTELTADVSVRFQQSGFHYSLLPGLNAFFLVLLLLVAGFFLWERL